MVAQFEAAYRIRYSFLMPSGADRGGGLVEAIGDIGGARKKCRPRGAPKRHSTDRETVDMHTGGSAQHAGIPPRGAAPGDKIAGPAIIAEANATTIVEPQWRAEVPRSITCADAGGAAAEREAIGTAQYDPVMLEVFNNLFMAIAEQMGVTLANTAYSVNIKERLDFSCAIFDTAGGLIANAPHLPVHLGAMGESFATSTRENAGKCGPAMPTC